MLRSVRSLQGYAISAADGDIGKVHDFYFDDESWSVLYLVVDTGSWLPGRKVLVFSTNIEQPDWSEHILPVTLTKQQIETSPDIDLDKPVSRQHEIKLFNHYGWEPYWTAMAAPGADIQPMVQPPADPHPQASAFESEEADPHLRSTREVTGYHISASDGDIGHVEDFIIDDEEWIIRYMVIDTRNWLPGKKVLISPKWIENVRWVDGAVDVNFTQESIKNCPQYDPSEPVNREYEARLYDYYGRPKYW